MVGMNNHRSAFVYLMNVSFLAFSCYKTEDVMQVGGSSDTIPKAKETILWLGTSIPAGYAAHVVQIDGMDVGNSYPNMVGKLLGCTIINNAVGSSRIMAGVQSLISEENPFGIDNAGGGQGYCRALLHTTAEKQEIMDIFDDYKEMYGWSYTLDDYQREYILSCSYEKFTSPLS